MSLAALQAALVSVFTDPEARAQFAADPDAFTAGLQLPPVERAQLRALGAAAVSSYARTLARKRRSEAAGFLPQTRASLGGMFAASFERWALQSPQAPDTRRNRSDASRYCDWLLGWEAGRGQSIREAVAWDRHELRATERPVHIGFARLSRRHGSTYGAWIKLGHLWHWHWQSNSKSRPARDSER